MTFDNENENDVNTEESSTPAESESSEGSSESEGSSTEGNSSLNEQSTQAKYVPYDRFQEVIQDKNRLASEFESIKKQFSEFQRLQQQAPQKQAEKDALIEEMRQVNPEFAKRFEAQQAAIKELEDLKTWRNQVETQNVRQQAVNMVNGWHQANKVSNELQEIYNAQIEAAIAQNPKAGLNDLKGIYDAVHQRFSKIFDARDRQLRQSYVTDKKKDASIPSLPKGQAPKQQAKKSSFSADPDQARKEMVQRIRQQLRADSDV